MIMEYYTLHDHVYFSWRIQYSVTIVHLHYYTFRLRKDTGAKLGKSQGSMYEMPDL